MNNKQTKCTCCNLENYCYTKAAEFNRKREEAKKANLKLQADAWMRVMQATRGE